MLIISAGFLSGCIHDQKDVFDEPAAVRMQKAIQEYSSVLTSSPNGWFADYYPETNHSVGGYAMYMKFSADGKVGVSCEIRTNAPAGELQTSDWEIYPEQGAVLNFSTYNPVMHYFSEPYSSQVNGRAGDYEFVIQNVTADQIELIGKKRYNKLILRKNISNTDPKQYFSEVAATEELLSEYGMFGFVVNNNRIGVASVVDRTFSIGYNEGSASKTMRVSYTFTPTGIRLYEPLEFRDVTMEYFNWDKAKEIYTCSDAGVNAFFDLYFPPDYELRYGEFIGDWEIRYNGMASATVFETATISIVEKKKNSTFQLLSDDLFDFPGMEVTFDAQKGIISILNQNAAIQEETGFQIRVCAYDRVAGYLTTGSTGPIGIIGVWNKDAGGVREIFFKDNGRWGTYVANGILLRLFNASNVSEGNFSANKGGDRFNNITITKIN